MGNCVTKINASTLLPGGYVIVHGTLTGSSNYATGGDTLNLHNVLNATSYPTVMIESGRLIAQHDKGTASTGKVKFFRTNYTNTGDVNFIELNGSTFASHSDASTFNAAFVAIGQMSVNV